MEKIKEFFKKHSKIITFGVAAIAIVVLAITTTVYSNLYKKAKTQLEAPVDVIHDTMFAVRNIVYNDTVHVVDTVFNFVEIKGKPDTIYIEVPVSKKNNKKNKK
jgi:hypothetical protein